MALRSAGQSRSSFQFCRDEPGTHPVTEANSKTLGKYFKEIKRGSSGKAVLPTAQLMCFYTNACSMSDKQEELEATSLLGMTLLPLLKLGGTNPVTELRLSMAVHKEQLKKEKSRGCHQGD